MTANMTDFIQPFQLESMNMRGRFVRLGEVMDQITRQHNYPDWVGFQLAECLLINAAIASAIKLRGKLSLQIQSEGAIKLISTDYFAAQNDEPPKMRGYVKYDEAAKKAGKALYQKGAFGILIDQGKGAQPYQGLSQLTDSITGSAVTYFAQSEQIPTVFHLDLARDELNKKWMGGAIMVQQIAEDGGHVKGLASRDDLNRVEALLGTVSRDEMLSESLTSEALIYRLFHEENPTASPAQPVAFGCPCSEDKVRQSLSIYSRKDLSHMITDEGVITADCQFCGAHYVLDPDQVGFEANK